MKWGEMKIHKVATFVTNRLHMLFVLMWLDGIFLHFGKEQLIRYIFFRRYFFNQYLWWVQLFLQDCLRLLSIDFALNSVQWKYVVCQSWSKSSYKIMRMLNNFYFKRVQSFVSVVCTRKVVSFWYRFP